MAILALIGGLVVATAIGLGFYYAATNIRFGNQPGKNEGE